MIVLGIDPGTAALGYGLVERTGSRLRAVDYGALHTSADLPLPERLHAIYEFLSELIELHHPTLVGVERVFHSRNVQTALAVGHARGVVLLAAAQAGIAVREATPNEVKIAVTGYGAADKEQVKSMVGVILGLPEPPEEDDAADALAVAIWTAHRERAGERLNAGLLDRAAVAPRTGAESPFDRAVREALDRERDMLRQWDGTKPVGADALGADGDRAASGSRAVAAPASTSRGRGRGGRARG